MTRYVKSSPSPWITAGRSGLISLKRTSSPSIDSSPSRRKSALNPISSVSPENADRHRLLRLADLVRACDHRELALGEPQLQRRCALDHHRRTANDFEHLGARQRQLVLELLGQELPVVRELAVDAARREPRAVGREQHLVLVHADLDGVAVTRDACELLQRAARDDRLELRRGAVELGLLDGEPVRIGRRHHELAAREADEDAGEHRPRLVTRRGARNT